MAAQAAISGTGAGANLYIQCRNAGHEDRIELHRQQDVLRAQCPRGSRRRWREGFL